MTEAPPQPGCEHPIRVYPGPDHLTTPGAITTPATVVGGELALSDDDDATYVDHESYANPAGDVWGAQSRSDFPGYESVADASFTLQLRCQMLNAARAQQFSVFAIDNAELEGYDVWNFFPDSLVEGETVWITSPTFTIPAGSGVSGGFFIGINAFLAAGLDEVVPPTNILRVFDLELCWLSAPTPLITPPLRQYPRPHPARHWPQSPTRQQGLRRGGSDIL